MSDSEGTKDLSGIARSVDALFSSDSPRTDVGEADVESGRGAFPDPPSATGDRLAGASVFPEMPLPEAPPPLPDSPAEVDSAPVAEVTEPEVDGVLEVDGPSEPDVEEVVEVDASWESEVEEVAAFDEPSEPEADVVMADEEDAPPAALALAVQEYVAGDQAKASEVEGLAKELLERRALDAVAGAVGELAKAAGDPPDDDTLQLAHAIATPVVYGRLARQIGAERDEARRKEYYLACRNLGQPMGVAIRDHLAESTDRHARRVHCEALVEMGPAGREIIEQMAGDENRFLVRNAVVILGETGGRRAVELVTSALANTDARVRKEALRSLAKLGDDESGELVLGLLEDPDPEVRLAAAAAAGKLHVERALRSIIKMLDSSGDPDEATPLIRALGQLKDPGAVASIEKHAVPRLFSRPRTDVRIAAYRALHQIGTPHARRLLNQAVDDKEPEVKAAVKEMLGMR